MCLAGYSAWSRVVEEHVLGNALSGRCVIQLTGGTNEEAREHAALVAAEGGRVVEGALMCFPDQLGTEEASLLVAGSPAALEECDLLLSTLSPDWTNLGNDITAPSILSRALFTGIATSLVGFVNSIAVAQAGGISMDVFLEHAQKANGILAGEKRRLGEAVRDERTERTQASLRTWAEAHETAWTVARSTGTNPVLQDAVRTVLREAEAVGLGDHDLAALVRVFAPE